MSNNTKPYTPEELDSPGWWAPGRVRATALALEEARAATKRARAAVPVAQLAWMVLKSKVQPGWENSVAGMGLALDEIRAALGENDDEPT